MINIKTYFFIKNKSNKWILGTDDKFSAWNVFKDNAQRLNTQEEVDAKLISINLTKDDVRILKCEVRDLPKDSYV